MICSLLDVDAPPETLAEFVFDRTDGNPFFVEEIINSLIEAETLCERRFRVGHSGPLDEVGLPTSVAPGLSSPSLHSDTPRRQV